MLKEFQGCVLLSGPTRLEFEVSGLVQTCLLSVCHSDSLTYGEISLRKFAARSKQRQSPAILPASQGPFCSDSSEAMIESAHQRPPHVQPPVCGRGQWAEPVLIVGATDVAYPALLPYTAARATWLGLLQGCFNFHICPCTQGCRLKESQGCDILPSSRQVH